MLKVGDTIKCGNKEEMVEIMTKLSKEGIEKDFLFEKDGKHGLWLEVKSNKSVLDNYTCEGQMEIADFPEVMP